MLQPSDPLLEPADPPCELANVLRSDSRCGGCGGGLRLGDQHLFAGFGAALTLTQGFDQVTMMLLILDEPVDGSDRAEKVAYPAHRSAGLIVIDAACDTKRMVKESSRRREDHNIFDLSRSVWSSSASSSRLMCWRSSTMSRRFGVFSRVRLRAVRSVGREGRVGVSLLVGRELMVQM